MQLLEVGLRPVLTVTDESHPLVAEQRDGITEERAHELAHLMFEDAA
jgi:hypothetical protein